MSFADPRISIISAVYNVASYLPDFLASLDQQMVAGNIFEVILVIDGSPDTSESMIRRWMATTNVSAKILVKENGGQASARNLGLKNASGEWVTFCDPDDFLADDYIANLVAAMDKAKRAQMFVTRLINFDEETSEFSNSHPLNSRFRDGDRLVDLRRSPDFFHMHGPTAVLRRKTLIHSGLVFNEKLRFSFEDAHLVASYLLHVDEPLVYFATNARYFYRRRSSGDSAIQTGALNPEKYTLVLEQGHLDLISQATIGRTGAPMWLQYLLVYDVLWYFRGDRKVGAPSRRLSADDLERFHRNVRLVLEAVDDATIQSFDVMGTDRELREALLFGYKHPSFRPNSAAIVATDESRQMVHVSYTYSGELPSESLTYKGLSATPLFAKSQPVVFLGRTMQVHRHIWLPSVGTFSLKLDGNDISISIGRPSRPQYQIKPAALARRARAAHLSVGGSTPSLPRGVASKSRIKRVIGRALAGGESAVHDVQTIFQRTRAPEARLLKYVHSLRVRARFANAWVLMDRTDRANDNAEHFYRYLLKSRPHVNSWFILRRDSADWTRLERDGFRLLAFGTREHYAALVHAIIYASSHLDRFVTSPLPGRLGGEATWRFVFLQHGVTLHDQSRWFNSKTIDLLVTSTLGEFASIISDGSPYKFSRKEVQLTGFPRHDVLVNQHPTEQSKRWILVSPTWRNSLTGVPDAKGNRAFLPGFASSTYATNWRQFLNSPHLASLAEEHGLRIGFLPHPMLEPYVTEMNLEAAVTVLDWDQPFSDIVRRSAVLITDYSSTAFEAAYANVRIVYFQFDARGLQLGEHIYDQGYFNFVDDGFGPVAESVPRTIEHVGQALSNKQAALYETRKNQTFAYRDSKNSMRVYKAIRRLLDPTPPEHIVKLERPGRKAIM